MGPPPTTGREEVFRFQLTHLISVPHMCDELFHVVCFFMTHEKSVSSIDPNSRAISDTGLKREAKEKQFCEKRRTESANCL